jgi:hypothetical protein
MRASKPLNRLYTKLLGVTVSNEGVLMGFDAAYMDMTGRTHLHLYHVGETLYGTQTKVDEVLWRSNARLRL